MRVIGTDSYDSQKVMTLVLIVFFACILFYSVDGFHVFGVQAHEKKEIGY